MNQDTKQSAAELLAASKQATRDHEAAGRRLHTARLILVTTARSQGMTWDEIAHHLGWSDGHALRMWYRRSGGER